MFGYMSVKEAAEKWGLSERRIQVLCATNRIPDVMRVSHVWLIPKTAAKPKDGRFKKKKRRKFRVNKILLIEDDVEISAMLKNFLATEEFEVVTAYDGESACDKFFSDSFSLVLLDLMIPKMSGIEVMGKIRENNTVPIIIISAKDTDSDKTLGLGLGADDYITKPFSVTEVLARIKANIRRSTQYATGIASQQPVLKIGNLVMNINDYSVIKDGRKIELTSKEFEILKLLLQNPKKVYTKEQIYSHVWNDAYFGDENAVNVHISRLRNKIEENPREPKYIITVWGIGYKLGEVKNE